MKLTPLDIQQQQFRSGLWGYDGKEVEAFLDLVAVQVERLVRENNGLKDEVRRKEVELEEHRGREATLKETMMTATRVADEMRDNARKESEILIAQAETQADQIVQHAHTRLVRVLEDLDELRRQKAQLEASLRSILEGHRKLLDAMGDRNQDAEEGLRQVLRRVAKPRAVPEGAGDVDDEDLTASGFIPTGGER